MPDPVPALSDVKVTVELAAEMAAVPLSVMFRPADILTKPLVAVVKFPEPAVISLDVPLAVSDTFVPPVTLFAPSASVPPVVVIKTAPGPPETAPVTFKPLVVSFTVRPLALNAPRFASVFELPRVAEPPMLPASVPALITVEAFWVTTPDRLSVVAPPNTTVPEAAVMLPSAAVVASRRVIAVPELLVVVSVLLLSWIGPSLASTRIVPLPALAAMPVLTVTPPATPPVRLKLPEVEVSAWPTVRPAEPVSEMLPLEVVSVPPVASVPPLLWKSILPVPVFKAVAGSVNVVPAIAVMAVFRPSDGAARVRASVSRIATVAPVAFNVTAPVKLLVVELRAIVPVPALTVVVLPATSALPTPWLTPTPVRDSVPVPPLAVTLLVPRSSAPPAVEIDTGLVVVPVFAEPVRISPPPESTTVSAPPR